MEAQCQSMTGAATKTSQFKCPCKEDKKHLGISVIIPKISDVPPELLKVQRKFFLGHGIKTTDTEEAANIFFERDHNKLKELLQKYYQGKLGVYIVPPMFYGEVPQAVRLNKFNVEKHQDKVRGDIAERTMYFALKDYYKSIGDDVLIIHSHTFFKKASTNEKDFLVFNLSKGK